MDGPNRLKGLICGDLRAGIGECAGDGFRLSLAPLARFSARISRGKRAWREHCFFLAAKEREETRIERKIKKNFDAVSMWQDYGKPIPPVFAHIGTPRRGLDKRGEID